jgi:hypothetical protein
MKLPKVVLILALVYAAAVLIPLRRAQRLFATPSATLSLRSATRQSLRRRTTGPRVVVRKAVDSQDTSAASRDATTPAVPRRRLAALNAQRSTVEKQQSVTAAERAGTLAHADCDRFIERDAIDLRPQALSQSAFVEGLFVATQAVADLTAPPPKHA